MTDLIDAMNEVRDATCTEVIEWVMVVFWDMAINNKKTLRNAWRKTGYDWFPGGLTFVNDYIDGSDSEGDDDEEWVDNGKDDNYVFDDNVFDENDDEVSFLFAYIN